ncbi:hypothetical protein Y032_0372g151 [Ancylostoma ceylanicum]|uniref:Uncharacterized protein n=1 Tax=Ancylostoma ceylanicum TaxID=53326 RepID=A0A016RU52_9BILA|nr:hypothetical protein Y032_0372g151 [Ancylostoma ceylanicum]
MPERKSERESALRLKRVTRKTDNGHEYSTIVACGTDYIIRSGRTLEFVGMRSLNGKKSIYRVRHKFLHSIFSMPQRLDST